MKLNFKSILAGLLMLIATTVMAQEKYEYAIVYSGYRNVTVITTKIESTTLDKDKPSEVEVLARLKVMNNEGWEVYDTNLQSGPSSIPYGFTFFLRRKIN